MKKFSIVLLAIMAVLSVSGCQSTHSTEDASTTIDTSQEQEVEEQEVEEQEVEEQEEEIASASSKKKGEELYEIFATKKRG